MNSSVPLDVYETLCEWNYIPKNLLNFWWKDYDYLHAAGAFHFKEVLNMLVIPTSDTCIERGLSIMNYVKARLGNEIQPDFLDAPSPVKNNFKFFQNNSCTTKQDM